MPEPFVVRRGFECWEVLIVGANGSLVSFPDEEGAQEFCDFMNESHDDALGNEDLCLDCGVHLIDEEFECGRCYDCS